MQKKLLIYAPFAIWSPHFETELELAESYLRDGYSVKVLNCKGSLPICEPNILHRTDICNLCKSKFSSGMRWLGKNRASVSVSNFYNLTPDEKEEVKRLSSSSIKTMNEIRSISIKNADIGSAALSSTITQLREPYPDLEKNEALIRKNIISAATAYFSIHRHLSVWSPDLFILFNGRFSSLRPALRAAQELKVETLVHERSGYLNRYSLTKNTYPHDLEAIKKNIESFYQNSNLSEDEKKELAFSWFKERRENVVQNWIPFTSTQTQSLLPNNFNKENVNLAIFLSSEDEFSEVAEWKNPFYKDQAQGLQLILDSLRKLSVNKLKIYLRIHPYLAGAANSQTRSITEIEKLYPEITVIAPDSKVSTYALIDAVDAVLTFGSTTGIEAIYAGKPSILMSRALYEDFGGCIRPKNHDDLISILSEFSSSRQLPLTPTPLMSVIKYGFYYKCGGHSYKYVLPDGVFNARMIKSEQEIYLNYSLLSRAFSKVRDSLSSFFNNFFTLS